MTQSGQTTHGFLTDVTEIQSGPDRQKSQMMYLLWRITDFSVTHRSMQQELLTLTAKVCPIHRRHCMLRKKHCTWYWILSWTETNTLHYVRPLGTVLFLPYTSFPIFCVAMAHEKLLPLIYHVSRHVRAAFVLHLRAKLHVNIPSPRTAASLLDESCVWEVFMLIALVTRMS